MWRRETWFRTRGTSPGAGEERNLWNSRRRYSVENEKKKKKNLDLLAVHGGGGVEEKPGITPSRSA